MRAAFVKTLVKIAEKDERVFLLTGDLGYGVLEPFSEAFPSRYFNMGVAEANMIGMSAGMAFSGKIPYVFSIATFLTMRGFEQIRNDVCYQKRNVKFIGVGSGLTYSCYGATHQSIDDIAVMRSLPNMVVLAPGDPIEVKEAIKFSAKYKGAVYIRLASKGEPIIHNKKIKFSLGKGILIKDGDDLTVMATGNMLENAYLACQKLGKRGLSIRLISMPFLKPIDDEVIMKATKETKAIFTIEEHCAIGGLGSAVADVLAQSNIHGANFHKISLPDTFPHQVGDRTYLRNIYGLTPDKIVRKIKEKIKYAYQ